MQPPHRRHATTPPSLAHHPIVAGAPPHCRRRTTSLSPCNHPTVAMQPPHRRHATTPPSPCNRPHVAMHTTRRRNRSKKISVKSKKQHPGKRINPEKVIFAKRNLIQKVMTVVVKSKRGIREKLANVKPDMDGWSDDPKDISEWCKNRLYQDWAELWRKGLPFHYHNGMTDQLGDTYSVEAYPDGSEILVSMTCDEKRAYFHFEKQLCGKGEGKYHPILNNPADKLFVETRLIK
jgi:hypothetical protein